MLRRQGPRQVWGTWVESRNPQGPRKLLGFRGLGIRRVWGVGFRGLGFKGLGFRVSGFGDS